MTTPEAFRFTHISDPHLTDPRGTSWRNLFNKRILGYLKWCYSRRFQHLPEILSVVAETAYKDGEHLVITGDLTQIGLPAECQAAHRWLADLGSDREISVIPGNHDAYVKSAWEQGIGLWEGWMQSDGGNGVHVFPFIKKRGPVVFIGISSAVPTGPAFATGEVDKTQLALLEAALVQAQDSFRVLLIHHSPALKADSFRKRLSNGRALRSLLAARGVELVLHGHTHKSVQSQLPGPEGRIPVIGAPSASAVGDKHSGDLSMYRGGYHAYEVLSTQQGWELKITLYQLDRSGTGMHACDTHCYQY